MTPTSKQDGSGERSNMCPLTSSSSLLPLAITDPKKLSESARQLIVPQAAAVATVLTKSILHPIDTIKIRVQAKRHESLRALYYSYRGQWGVGHLYAGLPIKLLLYAPYQSMYMTAYMWSKPLLYSAGLSAPPSTATATDKCAGSSAASKSSLLSISSATSYDPKHHNNNKMVKQNKSLEAITGALIAEFSCAFIRVPMEVMKVRLQASVTHNTRSAAGDLVRQGLRKTSRLFIPQTLCHDLPYSITQWLVYEHVRPVLDKKAKEWEKMVVVERSNGKVQLLFQRVSEIFTPDNRNTQQSLSSGNTASFFPTIFSTVYTPRAHWWFVKAATFGVGMSSGLVAGLVTVPLDNIKTRVIVKSNSVGGEVPSFFKTPRSAIKAEGVRGVLRGGLWRVVWISSNTACFFPIFDCVKEALSLLEEKD